MGHEAPPLDGIQVLDLTWNLPGPYAGWCLGSLGATVVKVEPPRGDPARMIGRLFSRVNRGKSSHVLDLRTEEGREQLRQMVAKADVVLEGFRPGVIGRLGLSPQEALSSNPRLVWCSISAFGQRAPHATEPGHDLNVQALTGFCDLERLPGGRPRAAVLPVADLSASLAAVTGIVAALYRRERSGEGAILDVAMTDVLADWTELWSGGSDLLEPLRAGPLGRMASRSLWFARVARRRLYGLPHYGIFTCADGRHLALGVVDEGHFWRALCDVLGLGRLGALPLPARVALAPALRPLVAARLRTATRRTWLQRLRTAGVPVSPVKGCAEAATDPWLLQRGLGRRAPIPGAVPPETDAPELGAHDVAAAGYTAEAEGV